MTPIWEGDIFSTVIVILNIQWRFSTIELGVVARSCNPVSWRLGIVDGLELTTELIPMDEWCKVSKESLVIL
mgnify:CR=1 FL=1